jgi:hypothetical protein
MCDGDFTVKERTVQQSRHQQRIFESVPHPCVVGFGGWFSWDGSMNVENDTF